MSIHTDLIERLERAVSTIDMMRDTTPSQAETAQYLTRLGGKADGLRVALSYVREDTARDAEMVADMRRALGLAESVRRIDPSGCGCTDCLTGYSEAYIPFADKHVIPLRHGWVEDAT